MRSATVLGGIRDTEDFSVAVQMASKIGQLSSIEKVRERNLLRGIRVALLQRR
jgi:hypothetical protein